MRVDSSLTEVQREAAVAWFEKDRGVRWVASELGMGRSAVKRLHERWRVRGRGALVTMPTKRSFAFEVKLDVVTRVLAGESKSDLAVAFGISSPKLIETWVRNYRNEGEDALRPKPKGRPRGSTPPKHGEESELERLRRENEFLRTQNAYLGKLRALTEQKRRTK